MLAKKIFASALEPHLKPLAVAAVLHGNDRGENIRPSVARLAWQLGETDRTIQRQLAILRARRLLIPLTPLTGGARRVVHYRFDASALPTRPAWEPRHQRQGSSPRNPDTGVTLQQTTPEENPDTDVAEPRHPRRATLTPMSPNPDIGVTRSVSDHSVEQSGSKSTGADAPAAPSNTPTHATTEFAKLRRDLDKGKARAAAAAEARTEARHARRWRRAFAS
jgi:hypothetical protein